MTNPSYLTMTYWFHTQTTFILFVKGTMGRHKTTCEATFIYDYLMTFIPMTYLSFQDL